MSPAHVLEPTYDAIKRRLMRGEWTGGTRLESVRIAEELGVSITPVRDSLYRLAGEKMVDFVHGEGFRMHRLTENELRDMLELNLILLLAAIATGRSRGGDAAPAPTEGVHRIAALFQDVGRRSGNAELASAVAALNDRLHLPRRFDTAVLGDIGPEVEDIEAALGDAVAPGAARNLVLRYHERRAQEADAYVRLLAGPSE